MPLFQIRKIPDANMTKQEWLNSLIVFEETEYVCFFPNLEELKKCFLLKEETLKKLEAAIFDEETMYIAYFEDPCENHDEFFKKIHKTLSLDFEEDLWF